MKDQIKLDVILDKDIVEWVDAIKSKLELRSRSFLINQMLREIKGDVEEDEQ